jgi:hypothetical protein
MSNTRIHEFWKLFCQLRCHGDQVVRVVAVDLDIVGLVDDDELPGAMQHLYIRGRGSGWTRREQLLVHPAGYLGNQHNEMQEHGCCSCKHMTLYILCMLFMRLPNNCLYCRISRDLVFWLVSAFFLKGSCFFCHKEQNATKNHTYFVFTFMTTFISRT